MGKIFIDTVQKESMMQKLTDSEALQFFVDDLMQKMQRKEGF